MMFRVLCISLVVWLAGCANVVKVEGEQIIHQRLAVTVTQPWNKVLLGHEGQPFESWTLDGLTLDHLRFWAAVKPGQSLAAGRAVVPAGGTAPRVPTFRAGMTPDELVGLFEQLYAANGSIVTLGKTAPDRFAGLAAVRFEFTVVRKSDGVQMRGVGWVAVHRDELFASTFVAPRLSFFARLLPRAEAVVSSARIL